MESSRLPQRKYASRNSLNKCESRKCLECGSQRIWKDGIRYNAHGEIQRYLCRECGYRFSEPNVKVNIHFQSSEGLDPRTNLPYSDVTRGELPIKEGLNSLSFQRSKDVASHDVSIVEKDINNFRVYNRERQVCVSEREAKNLSQQHTRQKQAAGATTASQNIKGILIEFLWKLKREGYSESTIECYGYIIKNLAKRGANLYDPENVKDIIAMQDTWSVARKSIVVKAYTRFLKTLGLNWQPPKYKPVYKLPFIPTEKEIDDLIAGCGTQIATFLQLLKETAVRCGEAYKLKWTDINFTNNTIRVTPGKGSNPRIFKVSNNLAIMINNLSKTSLNVFTYKNMFYLRKTFQKQRRRIAQKLGNPRIMQIHFHTLRHWKATMEYAKTKDILHVMQLLGHKNIKNTLKYTQLINFETDEYTCKVTKTLKEASQLIEAGFEYVTDMENYKIFRKRK